MQPSFGLGAMQKGSSAGRSVGRGRGEGFIRGWGKRLVVEGRGKEREIKGTPPSPPLGRGPSEITLDGTTHVRYGPGINHNVFGCKSERSILKMD